MAQVTNEGSSNKLDTELNLVPFIDLLSTLILFLLLSAAWQLVSAIPASVAAKGPSQAVVATEKRLELRVVAGGFRLKWPSGFKGMAGSAVNGEQLRALVAKAVERGLKMASVTGEDGVEYGLIVQAIDLTKEAGVALVALGVN